MGVYFFIFYFFYENKYFNIEIKKYLFQPYIKDMNWNYQINSNLKSNRNEKKIFILIPIYHDNGNEFYL